MDYLEILKEIIMGGGKTALMITAILLPLMIILELIKDANLLDPAAKVLRPAMKILTLPKEGAYPILAGVLFGISYGSGVILAFAKGGALNRQDLLVIGLFLAMCHGMIEDPLLFAAIGAEWWVLMAVRTLLAIVVMLFLSRIIKRKAEKSPIESEAEKTDKYVLLDRDGAIIKDKHYLSDPNEVELLPRTVQGLRKMVDMGWRLIVVTNQSGVGRGYFNCEDVEKVNARMLELLAENGVEIMGVFYCPHAPEDNCGCRKPRPGLAERAIAKFEFNPNLAVVIGDKGSDIELGKNIGARTILVRTGHGIEEEKKQGLAPDGVADDLADAARLLESEFNK